MKPQYVVDASIIVKWFLKENPHENYVEEALALLNAFKENKITIIQPVHWLAEVAEVTARVAPNISKRVITDLYLLNIRTCNEREVYLRANTIANKLEHHLFDTLYHAVALYSKKGIFLTADTKYFKKAQSLGNIQHLSGFFQNKV